MKDTQGLDENDKNESIILSLAVLLSSYLILLTKDEKGLDESTLHSFPLLGSLLDNFSIQASDNNSNNKAFFS